MSIGDAASLPWTHGRFDFQLDEPHRFRYAYESDGTRASVKAITDLDCDGIEVTWLLSAEIDAQGNVTTNLFAPPPDTD